MKTLGLRTLWHIAALGSTCLTISAPAAPSEMPEHPTKTDWTASLQSIKSAVQDFHVFQERRSAIIERLEMTKNAGRYDLDDPARLAERITEDMQDAGHDKHLWLRVDKAAYLAARASERSDGREQSLRQRRAMRNHHGLVELRLLPGNVRYLRLAEFSWVRDETGAVYDNAMRFLRDADAIVIDLRGNGGGSSEAVRYLISHFLDDDVLEMTFFHGAEPPKQSRTLDHLPAGRLKGKPLYVLIDERVGSAAEAFAYDVQEFKLGELIGTRTAGAANNNKLLPIEPVFMMSVSFGFPLHPVSNTNWEGVGIKPTVEADPLRALEVAQVLALQRLAASPSATVEAKVEYVWAQAKIAADLNPIAVAPARLAMLAGRYGDVEVSVTDGVLWLSRPGQRTSRLSPLTLDGEFSVEGDDALRAKLTGSSLELLWRGEAAPRVLDRKRCPSGFKSDD